MTAASTPPPDDLAARSRTQSRGLIRHHFAGLVLWKKLLLLLAVVMSVAGIAGSVAGTFRSKPPEVVDAQVKVEQLQAIGPHASLTSDQQQQVDQLKQKVDDAKHWFYDQTAPQLWRIGLGFAIAFVLGFMARQFLKTMASLAAIVVVGVGVAVYFGKLNAAGVQTDVRTGTGWVMDRLDTAKDALLSIASASLSGTVGFVLGFLRSKK